MQDDKENAMKRSFVGNAVDPVKKKPGSVKFDLRCLGDYKYVHEGIVTPMDAKDFTMDYYHKTGLEQVLVFNCAPAEIGMKIPPKSFTPRNVMEEVGEYRSVKVIDVKTQQQFETSLKEFVEYFETPLDKREITYNVISLEVSGTRMEDEVQAPSLVRAIDLASAWPDARKQRSVEFTPGDPTLHTFHHDYPRVEHYCLMSASASFTDFHIDFHGSSVWYHVFFLIPPTEVNIKQYEEYYSDTENYRFFGDDVEKCARVVVKAGQTLILPAGWIHAVYTPVDSMVFGGNFIHPRSFQMQIRIVRHEEEMGIDKSEKYPQADEVVFHYMDSVVTRVTGRCHVRPSARNRQSEDLQYVGKRFFDEGRHRYIPQQDQEDLKIAEMWVFKRLVECEEYAETNRILEKIPLPRDYSEVNEFFIEEQPHMLFHPKQFGVEQRLKRRNYLGRQVHSKCEEMEINTAELRNLIHPAEIAEWEAIIQNLLLKQKVNLPDGLTRPNSLLYSFFCLLEHLRKSELKKRSGDPTKFPVGKLDAPMGQHWTDRLARKAVKDEPEDEEDVEEPASKTLRKIKNELVEDQDEDQVEEKQNKRTRLSVKEEPMDDVAVEQQPRRRSRAVTYTEKSDSEGCASEEDDDEFFPTVELKRRSLRRSVAPQYPWMNRSNEKKDEMPSVKRKFEDTDDYHGDSDNELMSGSKRRNFAHLASQMEQRIWKINEKKVEDKEAEDELKELLAKKKRIFKKKDCESDSDFFVSDEDSSEDDDDEEENNNKPPRKRLSADTDGGPVSNYSRLLEREAVRSAGAVTDLVPYTKEEEDIIIKTSMKQMLDRYQAGLKQTCWMSIMNVCNIQQQLTDRTRDSIIDQIKIIEQRPGIKHMISDAKFKKLKTVN